MLLLFETMTPVLQWVCHAKKTQKKHGRNVVCVNASKQPSAEAVFGKAPKVSWKATWAVINWLSYTISSLTRTCSVHSSWIEKNWLLITVIVYRSIAVLTSCLCGLYLRITSASTYHRLLSLFSFFNVWSKDGWPKSRDVSPSESCGQAGCVFVLFSLPFFAFGRIHWCSLPGWDSYHNTASIQNHAAIPSKGKLIIDNPSGCIHILIWLVVSNISYVHPYLGKISNLTNIFQMGWNHQLVHLFHVFLFGM